MDNTSSELCVCVKERERERECVCQTLHTPNPHTRTTLTCLDVEGENLHHRLSKPVLRHQNKDVCTGAQWRGVKLKLPDTRDGRKSGHLAERGDRSTALVSCSQYPCFVGTN